MLRPLLSKRINAPDLAAVVIIFALRLLRHFLYRQGGHIQILINMAVDYLSVCVLYKGKIAQKSFIILAYYTMMFLCDALTIAILGVIELMAYEPVLARADVPLIAQILSRALMVPMVVIYIKRIEKIHMLTMHPALALPLPILVCTIQVIAFPAGDENNLFHTTPVVFYSAYVAILIMTIVFFYGLLEYRADNRRYQNELLCTQQIIELQERYYSFIYDKSKDFDAKLHDLKHHLNYATQESEYIREVGKKYIDELIFTGNRRIDSIIYYEKKITQENGLSLEIDGLLPPTIDWLNPVDLFTITDNAVRNAIIATKEQDIFLRKPITLGFSYKKSRLIITISNSTDKTYEKSDVPLPSRQQGHGHGMQNVLNTALNYDGYMEYEAADNIFELRVMLQAGQIRN